MQATEEAGNHLTSKGDDDAINFRPSTNFKYMKKYCKGKMETSGATGVGGEEDTAQPPLPRDPPPPESPPALLSPKREPEETGEPATEAVGEQNGVMCRQFARGACTRGAACIYLHEIVLSQLPGLYTFCRDFQNTACTFPRCKFVHATVFEKEHFYRSGYLPPHALAHLRDTSAQPPTEGGQADGQSACSQPAPAALARSGAAAAGGAEARPPGEARGAHPAPDLRDLGDQNAAAARETAAVAREPALAEPPASTLPTPQNSCSNCNTINIKRTSQRDKTARLQRSIHDLDSKTAVLSKKTNLHLAVLVALSGGAANLSAAMGLTPATNGAAAAAAAAAAPAPVVPPGKRLITLRSDKEKAVAERVNLLLSANGGHAAALDESANKGLTALLVRLLRGDPEAPAPSPKDA